MRIENSLKNVFLSNKIIEHLLENETHFISSVLVHLKGHFVTSFETSGSYFTTPGEILSFKLSISLGGIRKKYEILLDFYKDKASLNDSGQIRNHISCTSVFGLKGDGNPFI